MYLEFFDPMDNPLLFMLLVVSGILLVGFSISKKKINKIKLILGISLLLFCGAMYFAKTEMGMESFSQFIGKSYL